MTLAQACQGALACNRFDSDPAQHEVVDALRQAPVVMIGTGEVARVAWSCPV